jgi:hypothetical protein
MKTWIPFIALAIALFACSSTTPQPTDVPILPTDTVAVAATVAPTSIPSTPDVTEDWPVYENKVLGYSFKYPSSCLFGPMPANCKQSPPEERAPECLCFLDAENPDEVHMQAFLGDPDEGLRGVPFSVVHYDSWAFHPPAGVDVISWLNDQWSYLSEYIPSEPNAIIDEVRAVWVSVPGSPMAPSSDEIYVIWNDLLISIRMLDMDADMHREFYEQILSTFQFID